MKDIQFIKQENIYVAEFEVNADFNLHIEKSQSGYLYMQQRSTSGKWDSVRNFQVADSDYIVDYDFTALVYPKQIRLVSKYAPTMCVLTSDGDVIEIKSQTKDVEITQNGEMSVTPDDGFAYLSSVNVKTNVPQQGGGESGGGTSEDSWRYYRLEMNESTETFVQFYCTNLKADIGDGEMTIVSAALIYAFGIPSSNWKSIAINIDTPTYAPTADEGGDIMSFRELIEMQGGSVDELADVGLVSITKEEFYNLES